MMPMVDVAILRANLVLFWALNGEKRVIYYGSSWVADQWRQVCEFETVVLMPESFHADPIPARLAPIQVAGSRSFKSEHDLYTVMIDETVLDAQRHALDCHSKGWTIHFPPIDQSLSNSLAEARLAIMSTIVQERSRS